MNDNIAKHGCDNVKYVLAGEVVIIDKFTVHESFSHISAHNTIIVCQKPFIKHLLHIVYINAKQGG